MKFVRQPKIFFRRQITQSFRWVNPYLVNGRINSPSVHISNYSNRKYTFSETTCYTLQVGIIFQGASTLHLSVNLLEDTPNYMPFANTSGITRCVHCINIMWISGKQDRLVSSSVHERMFYFLGVTITLNTILDLTKDPNNPSMVRRTKFVE